MYVAFLCSIFLHLIVASQAISAGDMQSLHHYLMAWYNVASFDDYIELLALFCNMRAVEAEKAFNQCKELANISANIEIARLAILCRIEEHQSSL